MTTTARDPKLSPSLALLLALLRWPLSRDDIREARSLAKNGLADPALFLWLVRRHRVAPLIARNLQTAAIRLDDEFERALAAVAAKAARCSLAQAVETGRIAAAFAASGISMVTVKGVTLSSLAFGDPALRDAKDIDLVVAPEKLASAEAVFARLGYHQTDPDFVLTPRQRRVFIACGRHLEYRDRDQRVELHWRFAENACLFPLKPDRTERVIVGGSDLPTLPLDDLFLYLCIHGAEHAWFRLKWLADIAALLRGPAKDRMPELVRRAEDLGVARHLAQAALLANRLLAAPVSREMLAAFAQDRAAQRSVRAALRAILAGVPPGDPTEQPLFSTRSRLQRFRLGRGWRFVAQEVRNSLVSLEDWKAVRLPDPFFALYPLMRPIAWMPRLAKRLTGRITGPRPEQSTARY